MEDRMNIGLSISGGGFRATLFSLGSFCRLNEFGLLKKLGTVTSVSGGSILTAFIAKNWNKLSFDEETSVATNFDDVITEPMMRFCSRNVLTSSVLGGVFSLRHSIGDKLEKAYDKHLFKGTQLADLQNALESPSFIFYGSNYQTGSSVRFENDEISDYKLGTLPNPDISLAKVVAISSAFPPFLAPITLETNPKEWKTNNARITNDEFRRKLILCDGGLYDNLGLEAIGKGLGRYSHVLVCDAGAPLDMKADVSTNYISQFRRMANIMTDQQRALRKRKLITDFRIGTFGGTYFGVSTKISDYNFDQSMTKDSKVSGSLKKIKTTLNKFDEDTQRKLVNWGYALTDTAIRKHSSELLLESLNKRGSWPFYEQRF